MNLKRKKIYINLEINGNKIERMGKSHCRNLEGIKSFFYESKIFVKKQFHIYGTALVGIHDEIGRIKIRQLALPYQKAFP